MAVISHRILVHNSLINNLHIYTKNICGYLCHSYWYMKYISYIIVEIAPNIGQTFSIVFWVATRYVCSWVKQRIYNKYLKNSQLFTSKSSQSSLISFTHGLLNVPLSRSTQQLATSCECILKSRADLAFLEGRFNYWKGVQIGGFPKGMSKTRGSGGIPPSPKFLEILIANGAFWINLDHQLRAKISPILFIMFHALTSRILELLNRFIVIKSLTIEFSNIRIYCLNTPT